MMTNFWDKHPILPTILRNDFQLRHDPSGFKSQMEFVIGLNSTNLPGFITCSRLSICLVSDKHFLGFKASPAIWKRDNTAQIGSTCFYMLQVKTVMSLRYIMETLHVTHGNIRSILRWNMPGAFLNPNGNLANLYNT